MACRHNWKHIESLTYDPTKPVLSWCRKCGRLREIEYKTVNHKSGWHGNTRWSRWDYAADKKKYHVPTDKGEDGNATASV